MHEGSSPLGPRSTEAPGQHLSVRAAQGWTGSNYGNGKSKWGTKEKKEYLKGRKRNIPDSSSRCGHVQEPKSYYLRIQHVTSYQRHSKLINLFWC